MKTSKQILFLALLLFPVMPRAGEIETGPERNVDGIMDNSFLVEEAYNQEAGVVQHIAGAFFTRTSRRGPDDEAWELGFTQEWPFLSQTHQVGFTTRFSFEESGGRSDSGAGDLLINYRYQAYFNERTLQAFAPRASLILPTGADGFSDETVGLQINLPFSTALGDKWFLHANAGTTFLPEAESADDADLWHGHLGGSAIYAPSKNVHLLLEWIGQWEDDGRKHEFVSVISPGVRVAFNFANESQLVLGIAAPIGVTEAAPDFGVFLYCSFEHFFHR